MPIPFYHPKPAPAAAFNGLPLPQNKANPLSRAVFQWITPILRVGYSRPIQADDLWALTDDLQCQNNADELEAHFMLRMPPSKRIDKFKPAVPLVSPSFSASSTTVGDSSEDKAMSTRDVEKGELSLRKEDLRKEEDAIREEVAIVNILDDMTGGLEAQNMEGDMGGLSLPRVIPEGRMARDLVLAEKTPSSAAVKPVTDRPSLIGKKAKAELDPEDVKKYGKRKAKKIAEGNLVMENGQAYDMSILKAMYATVRLKWWKAVILSACGSTLQITAPLITRKIIEQLSLANAYHHASTSGASTADLTPPRSVGYGIGLAIALFAMNMTASLFNYQSTQRGAVVGFLMRASMIDLISRKSMRLSGKSRIELTNGRLTTMVSADASFLDFAAPMTLNLVVEPLQILVGIALLIYTLGYSALVGLAVLVLATPIQGHMFVRLITYRQAQMKIVDVRVRLLSEIINNIRAVKLYAYEVFFGEKVSKLRRQELAKLRRNGLNRATMNATMSFIPILASVLTFITYGLSGHPLNAAIIFSGLQYFNVLKQPISFLPLAFTAVTDAAVAVGRIGTMLRADELKSELRIDRSAKYAIDVQGDFQFDGVAPSEQGGKKLGRPDRAQAKEDKKKAAKDRKEAKLRKKQGLLPLDTVKPKKDDGIPFSLRNIDLQVPRGALVCIVGRVGTGKTALLSGLINEMKQLHGHVVFGGPVSYVPQHAWVQSGTIRENITFSSKPEDVDEARVNEIIDACALRPEVEMWPDGDETKIGEKGITLSGGQRQRICLARAAYDTASQVVLLDDPLSAVDAHVGHHLLHNCILTGPLSQRTRLLVTHHLDVLPRADLVLVLDRDEENRGRIIQHGTYSALREQAGVFRTLMEEFGSSSSNLEEAGEQKPAKAKETKKPIGGGGKLLLDEERELGAVSWRVYAKYAKAMGSWKWVGLCAGLLCCTQAATVGNSLFLGFWSGSEIEGFAQGDYMAIYAALGVFAAISTWAATYTIILAGIRASFALFDGAWAAVMRSPTGWHDRTPTGRIINRLSKDIEMLDDRLAQVWNQLLSNALSVVGTFALVMYSFPYLGLVFIPLGVFYYLVASYYRQTSREVKRVDSILRSFIYSSFGEQLAGLAVIRAFGQQNNFERRLQHSVNMECQAYIITITIQRWLGIRLDLLSYSLVMLISIFGAVFRDSISPSKLGVVLTYSLSAASVFSNLNNVERVQYYNDLAIEADPVLPTDPGLEWPSQGQIEFQDVQLQYRPDLPLVLKGLTFSINPGEKVGIIGRTGAGKSSIAQALFRTVELCGGKISVDGRDLRGLGLDTLRQKLAIIPQDAFLFGGTVRDNIDPTGARTDDELNAALSLIHDKSNASSSRNDKFQLDSTVLNEGGNFSAGERQLLALVRALARGCKVLLLDEATSSVDPATDSIIQTIIQTKFSDVTLISIAHRLQTVAYYDRILVMDSGKVAEFDTPLALFDDRDSAFRSLCDTKHLNRQDLLKIQNDAAVTKRNVVQ
ncbi:MAG: hypothetical protein TREMPRED_003289 [Tremellales sp. Tagirdzhanova-0007]|nr:MAG: hypothetical protein TREMPRED_003289 [Tremellales sp. Tagirdzhanova-0007]